MAGSDREGRSDGLSPDGASPLGPERSPPPSSLDQAVASHLGWGLDETVTVAFPAEPDPAAAWAGRDPLGPPAPPIATEGPPPWAEWAAAIAGPPPEPIAPEALPLTGDEPWEEPAGFDWYGSVVSGLASMLFHLVTLITLGLWITAPVVQEQAMLPLTVLQETEEETEPELETIFLDEQLAPGTELALVETSIPEPGSETWSPDDVRLPQLLDSARLMLDWPENPVSGIRDPLARVARGKSGSAQAVVRDYRQAMDRITQELLTLMADRKVLLIWCFDQSESMKDDQQEIRARLQRVYAELGMAGATSSDELMTAVTSFGDNFICHTERPTTDPQIVREAIDAVPIDPSGSEFMSSAVIRSIALHQEFARRQGRQMALILVSDESGDREEVDTYLEAAIGQALDADCRVYILGREAVFGYPYAYLRWVHPQTGAVHELPMDRGPETAFAEVLQTDGSEARSDAHPSGFGPYAQSRLAWRTGGIFFMLPTLESELIGGEKRRYDLAVMRDYVPDLRSREEILVDAQRHPIRPLIWKIVTDLDPNRREVAKMMNLPQRFAAEITEFRRQALEASAQAELYLAGLERGIKALDSQKRARDQEPSLRWQANYDLIRAQAEAYAARVYLYRIALEEAAKKLIVTPTVVKGDKKLVGWRVRQTREAPIDQVATKMLEHAKDLYLAVIENHPGTPWAARAEWELKRDFGYPGIPAPDTTAQAADESSAAEDRSGDEPTAGRVTDTMGQVARAGSGAGTGVGVGGGGGGGGGGGVGVGAGAGAGEADWGVDSYQGIEIVPEYRAPRPARADGRRRPGPQPQPPSGPPVPVPKI